MTQASVFDRIAALTVVTDDVVPAIYNYDDLPDVLVSNHLPARLLMPYQQRGHQAADFAHISLGRAARATRRIVDLLLLRAVPEGQRVKLPAARLVAYADAYEAVVLADRSLGGAQTLCRALTINSGVYAWPAGSTQYFGVEVVLTVEDYLHG